MEGMYFATRGYIQTGLSSDITERRSSTFAGHVRTYQRGDLYENAN